MNSDHLLAGVELGGTKTIAVLARGAVIVDRMQVATTTPADTLGAVAAKLAEWQPAALGIASFGPLALHASDQHYGEILATPKPGWEKTDLIAALARGSPVALSTDVIAAALAEGEAGAARGLTDFAYVTIGTGIGVGIIAAGAPLTGRLHPEAGHMFVPRVAGDDFAASCGFHSNCLEALASGPAIARRAGCAGSEIGDDDPAWRFVVDALAHAFANLRLTLACQSIVIGGGVAVARPWLAAAIAARMDSILGDYLPGASSVVPALLGADAGPRGALLLARNALAYPAAQEPVMPTDVIIYHNPACGTSRNVLAMISAAGIEPHIVEYLETPPSRAMLVDLLERAGLTPRDLLRAKEPLANELDLVSADDATILDAMVAHPILINRPLVVSPLGARLCRPSEQVLALLPTARHAAADPHRD